MNAYSIDVIHRSHALCSYLLLLLSQNKEKLRFAVEELLFCVILYRGSDWISFEAEYLANEPFPMQSMNCALTRNHN